MSPAAPPDAGLLTYGSLVAVVRVVVFKVVFEVVVGLAVFR